MSTGLPLAVQQVTAKGSDIVRVNPESPQMPCQKLRLQNTYSSEYCQVDGKVTNTKKAIRMLTFQRLSGGKSEVITIMMRKCYKVRLRNVMLD